MPPYGYQFGQPRPPEDENLDLAVAYANMIRGVPQATTMQPPDRQLGLMGRLRQPVFYGPSQGIAGPVPRGTSEPPYIPPGVEPPGQTYGSAMGLQEPEPSGPPEPAIRVSERGEGEESDYRRIADEYLRSLQQPYRLPEPTPYSKREKLAMLAAREPWQREVIVSQHREPYERAMAEAQITERRRSSAAGVASDLEKARAYERYRLSRENQPSQELDYTDKVEKAQADVGNVDYPYTKPQWKALAEFKATTAGNKLPGTKEQMLKELEGGIRAEEDQILQARSDVMGMDLGMELSADRQSIIRDAGQRKAKLAARRNAIAGMTPDIYRKFRNLTAEQQEEVMRAYEKKMAASQNPTGQPGPVAPQQSYYP